MVPWTITSLGVPGATEEAYVCVWPVYSVPKVSFSNVVATAIVYSPAVGKTYHTYVPAYTLSVAV